MNSVAEEQSSATCAEDDAGVHNMPVSEVRRSLSYLRRAWEDQINNDDRPPLYLSDAVLGCKQGAKQSLESFSLRFVLAHHTRRLGGKAAPAPQGEDA